MQIRQCRESDISDAGRFYDRVVSWMDQNDRNYPKWVYKGYPTEKSVRLMTAQKSQYLCIENERIIGAFALNADPQGNYQKGRWRKKLPDGDYMVLHTLAIDPKMQGTGVGSEVISFCVEKAKEEGYQALRVDIVPDNLPARHFYEKNGFTHAGDADLDRGIPRIPIFSMFERNW